MSATNNFKNNNQPTQQSEESMEFEETSNENPSNVHQPWTNDAAFQFSQQQQCCVQQYLDIEQANNAETLLLDPVYLTGHCKCVDQPLIPTLPLLTEEWHEDCTKYQQEGPSFEALKKLRHMPFQPHITDNTDFRILMINMYIDDYNQRLLCMRQQKEPQIFNTIEVDSQRVPLIKSNQHNSEWVLKLEKQEQQSHAMCEGQYTKNYGVAAECPTQNSQYATWYGQTVVKYEYNNQQQMDNQNQVANPIVDNYFNQPQQQDSRIGNSTQECVDQCMKCLLRLRYTLLTAYSNQYYSGLMMPNDFNQQALNINMSYPYLQTPTNENTYTY